MKKRMAKIALAQIKYFEDFKKDNLEKIKKYIRLAKKEKADIVCFPEYCLHKSDPLNLNHRIIKEIRKECKVNSIWCIVTEGIVTKKKQHDTAILINREGKIKGKYKKIHLYDDHAIPGKKRGVFTTDFGKIGIALCWDMAFPELFRKMKKAGAEIVFCPAQWAYDMEAHHVRKYEEKAKKAEEEILASLITARAFENIFFVAFCNPIRKTRKDQISYSAIASPSRILEAIKDREGLITANIYLDEIPRLEKLFNER